MNSKENLTDATVSALIGQESNTKVPINNKQATPNQLDCKFHLSKLAECYANENDMSYFIDVILDSLDDAQLYELLNSCQQNYAIYLENKKIGK